MLFTIQEWRRRLPEKVQIWIAWHLPESIVKWAYIRVFAHATTRDYGSTVATDVTAMDVLQRWAD